MKIQHAALSDPGKKRENNEDNYLALPDKGLFMVADGMGGHNAGELASATAVKTVAQQAERLPALEIRRSWWRRFFKRSKTNFNPVEWLHQSLAEANAQIYQAAQGADDKKGMGTTVAVILTREQALLTAHVGDSRVYRFRDRRLSPLTQDHSLAQELVRQGVMTEAEALYSAPSNVLTRALGVRNTVAEDIIYHSVEPGDVFLLCSDGLYNMIDDDDIIRIISQDRSSLEDKTRQLVEASNQAGGEDNITVILVLFQ